MSKSERHMKALLKIAHELIGISVDDMTTTESNIAAELVKIQFLQKVDNHGVEEYTTVINTLVD